SLRFWWCDFEFIGYVAGASDFRGFGFDGGFFFLGSHRAFQSYAAIAADNFDVVRVGGKRFIVVNSGADFSSHLAVGRVDFLLVGGDRVFVAVAFIGFGIVRGRLLSVLRGQRSREQRNTQEHRKNETLQEFKTATHRWFLLSKCGIDLRQG